MQRRWWLYYETVESYKACLGAMINMVSYSSIWEDYNADLLPLFPFIYRSDPAYDLFYLFQYRTCRSVCLLLLEIPFVLATANFLLESTIERLHYKLEFADRDIGELTSCISQRKSSSSGVLLIRGENVVALGEIVSSPLKQAFVGCWLW